MEPITTAWLIGTVVSTFIGNRSDELLCKSTNKLYARIKNKIHEPTNHHIQRAIRKSYLSATFLAVNHSFSQYTVLEKFVKKNPMLLQEIEDHIKLELKAVDQGELTFKESVIDSEYRAILFPKEKSSGDRKSELVGLLKDSVISELGKAKLEKEQSLLENILNGWSEDGKEMDWYKLTCAFFTQELKDNNALATIIQTEYLDDINQEVGEINLKIDELTSQLNVFFEEYVEILPRIDELLSITRRTEEKVDRVLEILENVYSDSPGKAIEVSNVIDFSVLGRHQNLIHAVESYVQEEKMLQEEIEDAEIELKEARLDIQPRKQRILNRAQENLKSVKNLKVEAKNDLKEFVSNVLKLAKQLNELDGENSARLSRALELFSAGKYEEIDQVLEEAAIYDDISKHKERADALAGELLIKARTLMIAKNDGWWEKVKKYYIDASDICRDPEVYLEFAFLLYRNYDLELSKKYMELGHNQGVSGFQIYNSKMLKHGIDVLEGNSHVAIEEAHQQLELIEKNDHLSDEEKSYYVCLNYFSLGLAYRANKELKNAIDYFNKFLVLDGEYNHPDLLDVRTVVFFLLGKCHSSLHEKGIAEFYFDLVVGDVDKMGGDASGDMLLIKIRALTGIGLLGIKKYGSKPLMFDELFGSDYTKVEDPDLDVVYKSLADIPHPKRTKASSFDKSLESLQEAERICEAISSEDEPIFKMPRAKLYNAFANLSTDHVDRIDFKKKAIEQLEGSDSIIIIHEAATCANSLGDYLLDHRECNEALEWYMYALEKFRKLEKSRFKYSMRHQGIAFQNMSVCFVQLGMYTNGLKALKAAKHSYLEVGSDHFKEVISNIELKISQFDSVDDLGIAFVDFINIYVENKLNQQNLKLSKGEQYLNTIKIFFTDSDREISISSKTALLVSPSLAFKEWYEINLLHGMLEEIGHPLLLELDLIYPNIASAFHDKNISTKYKRISVPFEIGGTKIVLALTIKNCLTLSSFKEEFVKVLFEFGVEKVFFHFAGAPLKELHDFFLNEDTWDDLLYCLSDSLKFNPSDSI